MKKTITKALALFERHEAIKEHCDKCNQTREREPWYSFTREAIKENSPLYSRLSDIIHDSKTGEDYAYNWVVRALETIDEMIDEEEKDPDTLADLDFSEAVDGEVDVYTSELMRWLSSSVANIYFLDEVAKEYGATENVLGIAQYKAIEEIFYAVRDALMDELTTK